MSEAPQARRVLGRYLLADAIASGGMATIHLGRLLGPVGFARTVAIKRLHPQYAKDPEFVASFLDEARLAAKIQHPNVGGTLDVVAIEGELFLVMEYVDGESLSHLIRRAKKKNERVPPRIASAIVSGVLYGLHAAHEARDDLDEPLGVVHRDVSPQNILVGADGVPRVVDFGIAKAAQRVQETEVGRIKGKFGYMSPEQVKNRPLDRRTDVFAAGVVLWEALTGERLFEDEEPFRIMKRVVEQPIVPPSRYDPSLSRDVDRVVLGALERDREARFQTAREMAIALEKALPPALGREVGEWVQSMVGDVLARRARALSRLQREGSEPSPVASLKELAKVLDSTEDTADFREDGRSETTTTARVDRPEPASEISVASWNAETQKTPPRTQYLVAGAVAGVILFAGLLVAISVLRSGGPSDVKSAPAASVEIVEPPPQLQPQLQPQPSADPTPPASTSSAPEPVKPDAGRAVPPRPVKKNCVPPYTVTPDGIKKYKPWCI